MAIAPSFTTGLLGYNPREEQLQQQKLWAGLYGQASSPYEKIGMGVGQLGSALIGGLMGESATQKRERTLLSVKEAADQQFTPGTPEYYKFVADNLPAGAEYSQSKDLANQEFAKARKAALEEEAREREAVRKDPESLDTFTPKYAMPLLAKAQARGFDPEKDATPQTAAEIKAFAKLYDLDKEPNYNKLMGLRTLAEKEAESEAIKKKTSLLNIESIESTIKKNNRELQKLEREAKFDQGDRWNAEREAALALFAANGLDPYQKLPTRALANTEIVNAQKIALREPFTGKAGIKITPSGEINTATVLPLPADKLALQKGKVYATPNGNAKWDGSKFTVVTQ